MLEVSLQHGSNLFFARTEVLQDKLHAFRVDLAKFKSLTQQRWTTRSATTPESPVNPTYDSAYRGLMAAAEDIQSDADDVIRVERGVLHALQTCLIVGALLVAGVAAMTLFRYLANRRRMEMALRESEEKFRSLYEMSDDAIMLLDEKHFFDCNKATLSIFKVESKEEFCRMHPADLSPTKQPDGTDSMTLANRRIATAMRDGVHRFEWAHMRTDGTEFPAEVLLTAIHLEGRRVLQGVVRDVTERKKAERLLKANEEKLRTISHAALDAVIMMDAAGRALHWNPAAEKMFGYQAEEVLGCDIHQLVTPKRLQLEASTALYRFFKTGQGRAVGRILELPALHKNGEEFPVEISLSPIRLEGQWCAVAVVRDITDRKRAEELVKAEQRSLRRLLKAHDQERKLIAYEIHDGLAQQLVAAIMQCQAATRVAVGKSDTASETFSQLLELLRQCLAETRRLISGVRPPILDEFGVVTAIRGFIEETEAGGGPDVEFRNTVAFERLAPVLETSIYRIIQESVGNACRHSRSNKVLIELTHEKSLIRIRVQDWGVGFDPLNIDRKRYGLAGIRERARLLGGSVNIDSSPGKGTRIVVKLPEDVGDLAETELNEAGR